MLFTMDYHYRVHQQPGKAKQSKKKQIRTKFVKLSNEIVRRSMIIGRHNLDKQAENMTSHSFSSNSAARLNGSLHLVMKWNQTRNSRCVIIQKLNTSSPRQAAHHVTFAVDDDDDVNDDYLGPDNHCISLFSFKQLEFQWNQSVNSLK